MREGRLFNLCNKENSVIETSSKVFSGIVILFARTYIGGGFNIMSMHEVNTIIEGRVKKDVMKAIGEFYGICDKEAVEILEQAI